MVDVDEKAIAVGGIAFYTLKKLLGPTADYLGGELKSFVEKSRANIGRIFGVAARRLRDKLDEPGTVEPRVLARILEEGRFCEDALAAEYFGGLLASSRSKDPHADRALPMLAALKNLPTLGIRLHYIGYGAFREAYSRHELGDALESELSVFIRAEDVFATVHDAVGESATYAIYDGAQALLITDLGRRPTVWGNAEAVRYWTGGADEPGFLLTPNEFGIKLLLWVHGHPNVPAGTFFDRSVELERASDIQIPAAKIVARHPRVAMA